MSTVVMNEMLNNSASEMEGKYLTFYTEKQLFGIPIADVVQIVSMQEITQVPEYPAFAKGIINLRGSIIPVIDMRLRLGKQEKNYDERTCIIVTMIEAFSVGFIVDEVDAVTNIENEMISPPPKVAEDVANDYLTGIARLDGRVVLLMTVARLLSQSHLYTLSAN